jgi:phosphoribosyl-ATP pyrophosphohydrolase/phosphoribosyl-AMP cyclohydrolase
MKPDFEKNDDGLLPVIIQDVNTKRVLMLGYMNEKAYKKTLSENKAVFYSRSKKRLWMKGETSGNFLHVKEILADCDNDTILIKAIPDGPVCHTGADTCFNEVNVSNDFLNDLEKIISQRKKDLPENSYTASLFRSGINKIAQKVGEEAVELIIEEKDNDAAKFKNEAADLLFHFLVLLQKKNVSLNEIRTILEERHSVK